MSHTKACQSISVECSIEDTIYGYYPSLAGNAIMVTIFGICAVSQVYLGIKYRLRAYPIVVCLGCLGECIGYIGRVVMHFNPWEHSGFIMQILLLIISPSLLAAGLYLTLKHLVLHYGSQYSRLSAKLYTWLFVGCDILGFLTQCIGGTIQASANDTDRKTLDLGNDIMVAGICFQAATMVGCGILSIDFAYSLYRHREERKKAIHVPSLKGPKGFQFYMSCFVIAFVAILVRCVYRIPEMAGGWKNSLMRNEVEFMVLDGAMIAFASILLTVAFPGAYFPAMNGHAKDGNEIMKEDCEAGSEELSVLKPAGFSQV